MRLAVPAVVVADHPDGGGVRGPDGEGDPLLAVERAGMGAEDLPQALVSSFGDQMQVDVAECGGVAVGIALDGLLVVAVCGGEAIGERR